MFKKILVPLDGSRVAERILPQVGELAKIHDSEVTLLQVVLVHAPPVSDSSEPEAHAILSAEKYLKDVEQKFKNEGIKVSSIVRYGHEAGVIIDHAKRHGFDLIAMSTHGRSGLGQFVLGSVASKILHASQVPVLLFRIQK
ncbi:MAG: universal stress protein [Syntrophales bacterium]|jgi:nucleotide-binding universal stress UspA family protein|nr:universal stress protein [Syntrophales bacterium]